VPERGVEPLCACELFVKGRRATRGREPVCTFLHERMISLANPRLALAESAVRPEPRTGRVGACAARSGASVVQVIRRPRLAKPAAEADTSVEVNWNRKRRRADSNRRDAGCSRVGLPRHVVESPRSRRSQGAGSRLRAPRGGCLRATAGPRLLTVIGWPPSGGARLSELSRLAGGGVPAGSPIASVLHDGLHLHGVTESDRQDSNLRPPRPQRGALPGCATVG
jgi:hypothetical protein